jgi:hypothetical protein
MPATKPVTSSPSTPTPPISIATLWTGRIASGLVVAFLLFDSMIKILKLAAAVEGTVQLGYPTNVIRPLGVVLLVSVVLYAIPRTAVLGAILLTGFLGGAIATQVRVENAWFFLPIFLGVMVWGGLFLRDERVQNLIPVRR